MKKYLIIFTAFIVLISSIIIQPKKSEAAALPLLAPVAVGVGVYGVGLTMAVLLTAQNQKSVIENFQETLPQAKEDWNNFSSEVKDNFINAYNSYIETGSNLFKLTPTMLEAMQRSYITSYPELTGLSTVISQNNISFRRLAEKYVDLNFEGTFYMYLADGREISFSRGILHLEYTQYSTGRYGVLLKDNAHLWSDVTVPANVLPDFSSVTNLPSFINTWNKYVSISGSAEKYITNVSTISIAGAENNTLTNKDYWDSQIDKVLQKDDTGSYVLPIPDTYAYPPMSGTTDVPDKSISLGWNPETGQWVLPDGTPFTGNPVLETAPPTTVTLEDGSTVVAIPQTDAITGDTVYVDVTTGEAVGTGEGTVDPPTTGTPESPISNPFKNLFPVALLLSLLDMLRAILFYILRVIEFVISIPMIPEKSFNNSVFEWFRSSKFLGIYVYDFVSGLATLALSLSIFRYIRKVLP